jgi:uncharacterized protein
MRLVLDTNIVVAALLWNGTPRRLLDQAIYDEALSLYSSPTLIDELAHTLQYPKFARRISLYVTTPAALVAQYTALVTLRSPTQVPRVIEHDADDDHVLAAASSAPVHQVCEELRDPRSGELATDAASFSDRFLRRRGENSGTGRATRAAHSGRGSGTDQGWIAGQPRMPSV